MITLNEYLGGKVNKRKKLIPRDKEELELIIIQRLEKNPDLILNDIDVSEVGDLKELFSKMNVRSVDIGGWDIDEVDEYMFCSCKDLKSVILPDSVKSIRQYAFYDCNSLTEINILNPLESIEQYAFYNCNNLTEINISNSVKCIEKCTFFGCNSLTNINISNSVKNIKDRAFAYCEKLTNINIPNSVKRIGWGAFYNVPHITYHGPATWTERDYEYWGAKSMN